MRLYPISYYIGIYLRHNYNDLPIYITILRHWINLLILYESNILGRYSTQIIIEH